jgi:hypothetical protein
LKRQYVLGIDVRRNRIVSTSSGVPLESLIQMTPRLLPFDLCASLHGGAKDRQVMAGSSLCHNLVQLKSTSKVCLLAGLASSLHIIGTDAGQIGATFLYHQSWLWNRVCPVFSSYNKSTNNTL